MSDATQYIVTVKGSPRDGYTSHIEKILLPNGAEHASEDIQAQIKAQIKKQLEAQLKAQLKAHPEGANVPIRFIVTVDGSPSKGYTAKAEKVKPKPTKEEVIKLVEEARSNAEKAANNVHDLLRAVYNPGWNINNETYTKGANAFETAKTAVAVAEKVVSAVANAEEAIHSNIEVSGRTLTILEMVEYAKNTSNEAKDLVEKVVNMIKEKQTVDVALKNAARSAKRETEQVPLIWNDIYNIITTSSGGGYHKYHKYRNQTCRKYKQRKQCKHYTARKS